ncbi:MAG: hypothetical protein ACE5G1_08755, partial [bacterium]
DDIEKLRRAAQPMFTVKTFAHSLNLNSSQSELRIQIQTDPRYQGFIAHATQKKVLGYDMKVAALEDVVQGKIWAYSDQHQLQSKRQKDLADI